MASKIPPFFIFYGDEEVLLNRAVFAHKASFGDRDVITLNGSEKENSVVTLCETRAMFGDVERHVVIQDANDIKLEGALKKYLEELNPEHSSSILTAVIHEPKLPTAWAALAKSHGSVSSFLKLKRWDKVGFRKRVIDEAHRLFLNLDEGALEFLDRHFGDNLAGIYNELGKLKYFVSDGFVTKAHVVSVISPDRHVKPWEVADAALARKLNEALHCLTIMYANDEGSSIPVANSLLSKVEQLLIARQMLDQGDGPSILAVRFNMTEWACRNNLLPLMSLYTTAKLKKHYNRLCKLDYEIRSSARSKRTLVELAVIAIAKDQ